MDAKPGYDLLSRAVLAFPRGIVKRTSPPAVPRLTATVNDAGIVRRHAADVNDLHRFFPLRVFFPLLSAAGFPVAAGGVSASGVFGGLPRGLAGCSTAGLSSIPSTSASTLTPRACA